MDATLIGIVAVAALLWHVATSSRAQPTVIYIAQPQPDVQGGGGCLLFAVLAIALLAGLLLTAPAP
ncbi:MAG TPA: hypothetical protein VFU22_02595 [Roseiflexaceae bacterium]|nr:hypothetical protein [Roseiflexaceae bacterium]